MVLYPCVFLRRPSVLSRGFSCLYQYASESEHTKCVLCATIKVLHRTFYYLDMYRVIICGMVSSTRLLLSESPGRPRACDILHRLQIFFAQFHPSLCLLSAPFIHNKPSEPAPLLSLPSRPHGASSRQAAAIEGPHMGSLGAFLQEGVRIGPGRILVRGDRMAMQMLMWVRWGHAC